MAKNIKTPRSPALSPMVLSSRPNQESRKFTLPNGQKKSSAYSAEQAANYTEYQKQQEGAQRERENAAAKQKTVLIEQEAAKNRTQALHARYSELQKQEDDLLLQIGEAKQPGPAYYGGKNNRTLLHHPNPQKSQLPLLQSHLSDVRREKGEVRKQLEKAQR